MIGRAALREPAPSATLVRLPSYPWLVVGTVCIGAFIGQADASIVQLAMPAFEDAFDAPLGAVSWVAVGYALAFAAALPAFARLAEIKGRKALYLAGFALFGVMSAACALAPNLPCLIAFRVLLGTGGAMLGANSLVILVNAAGQQRRGKALGVMSAAQAVGLALGPALGGVLLGLFGWRSIFWVSVPVSLLGAALGWLIVPQTAKRAENETFDLAGALLMAPALAALFLAMTEARAWGLSVRLVACLVAAPALFALFVWREATTPFPLVRLSLFRIRAFSAGSVGVLVSYAMLYALFFAMSFAFVRGYHEPPVSAGLRLTVVPVALGLVAPYAGGESERRPRLIMLLGMGLCAAAALAVAHLLAGAPGSPILVMAGLAMFGAGLGLFIAPNNSTAIAAAPADKSGVAGGILNLLRVFGTGLGVAAASATLAWRLELTTGVRDRTAGVPEAALLSAVGDVLVLLAGLAAIGALTVLAKGAAYPPGLGLSAAGSAAGAPRKPVASR